jgi:hypothetical protein
LSVLPACWRPPSPGLVLLLCWPERPRSAVAPAPGPSVPTHGPKTAPFVEEVAFYEPQSAPLPLRGTVAVVVRSSLLEEAHANGPVNAGGIQGSPAWQPHLCHTSSLAAALNPDPVGNNLFAGLPTAYPRAWACLTAVTHAFAKGGRWPYQAQVRRSRNCL